MGENRLNLLLPGMARSSPSAFRAQARQSHAVTVTAGPARWTMAWQWPLAFSVKPPTREEINWIDLPDLWDCPPAHGKKFTNALEPSLRDSWLSGQCT